VDQDSFAFASVRKMGKRKGVVWNTRKLLFFYGGAGGRGKAPRTSRGRVVPGTKGCFVWADGDEFPLCKGELTVHRIGEFVFLPNLFSCFFGLRFDRVGHLITDRGKATVGRGKKVCR